MTSNPLVARTARRLRVMTLLGTALVAAGFVAGAAALVMGRDAALPGMSIEAGGLPPMPAAIMMALFGLLIVLALLRLAAMLREVERGVPFPAAALRGFARYLCLAVIASLAGPPALAAIWGVEPVTLSFDSNQVLMLLVTGMLFLVARLLDEARAIADDASQIV
ncbi:MAG: hypothetical protein KF780_13885 [Sphingomonas sp.]|nr:hypothetical protein [Sphingomonas sp.]